MVRKRDTGEDILKLLRGIELQLVAVDDLPSACRSVEIGHATQFNWRKRLGGMGRSQLSNAHGSR